MHCQVCGAKSGKYPLCKICNRLKEQGLVTKCGQCGRWHRTDSPCPAAPAGETTEGTSAAAAPDIPYLYKLRKRLISANEQNYFTAIQAALPPEYHVYPQINLAAVIERTDHARFCNELFRNVDFMVTDGNYTPKIAVEINDQTHQSADRRERDKKVRQICEEAGLPLVTLWTSYGVQPDYIQKRLTEALETPPARVHHFSETAAPVPNTGNTAPIPVFIPPYSVPVTKSQRKKPVPPALVIFLVLLAFISLFALVYLLPQISDWLDSL